MNPNISRLHAIAAKPTRTIIGLMSGTSFDGLDIALCEFTGSGPGTKLDLKHFATKEYSPAFKEELKSIFAKSSVNLERVALLNEWIGIYYAQLITQALAAWKVNKDSVDLIASHGQSIFHSPRHQRPPDNYGNATLQIGDGDHLAVHSGITTLSDFRQKNIAAGGEGAPLAVYGDYLLLSSPTENRILLNIGGIANFTYLPASGGAAEEFFSTDVGPGNTLMDQFVQANFPGQYYDKDSAIGFRGTVNEPLLQTLRNHPFFEAPFPKTTGPELFNLLYLTAALVASGQPGLSPYDIMATLAAFSATQIIDAIETKGATDFTIYASGGGIYNPQLMQHLKQHFGQRLKTTSALQLNPDAKEAVLFALLANEAVAGNPTGPKPQVSMGKISFPQ